MYISAEVDDQQIVIEALHILFRDLPTPCAMEIAEKIFHNGTPQMRDWVGLAIYETRNPKFIDLLKNQIARDSSTLLCREFQRIVDYLNEIEASQKQ